MSIRCVDGTSEEERRRTVSAVVLAFVRDPVARWMYPEPESYLRHFPGFVRAFGGPAFASSTVWADEGWGGAALWLPAGVQPDGEAIEAHVLGTTPQSKRETTAQVLEKMGSLHPEEPHWYLPIIGVDAAHQGKGLGSRLLQGALARCDAERLPAYLESSNPANIPLYERHGFRVVSEIRVGDAPVVTPMFRKARSG